ncbi:toxin-antitoxin system, toxin component [Streptomyces sp. TRM70308]|uniref:toxin-antitoxin system, toxin component n=1 Tax=Streptomyces sp. TRM70308 TaxID=3131932 RepID=UPI003D06D726
MKIARRMRRLSADLVAGLEVPESAAPDAAFEAIARSASRLRGRPVRLRGFPFPPDTVSGLWVDREHDDVIAYHQHTDVNHQLVIVGHEIWHMVNGHCGDTTAHGPASSRSASGEAEAVAELVRALATGDAGGAPGPLSEAALHYAARTHFDRRHEEEAELFGYQFGTDVRAVLNDARVSPVDRGQVAGRIELSLGHRGPRS